MNDYMWTTEQKDEVTQLREQLDRLTVERDLERTRQERQRVREQMSYWQEAERDLRSRMLRANWPESGKESVFDVFRPDEEEKDSILKPLPDELFEID